MEGEGLMKDHPEAACEVEDKSKSINDKMLKAQYVTPAME